MYSYFVMWNINNCRPRKRKTILICFIIRIWIKIINIFQKNMFLNIKLNVCLKRNEIKNELKKKKQYESNKYSFLQNSIHVQFMLWCSLNVVELNELNLFYSYIRFDDPLEGTGWMLLLLLLSSSTSVIFNFYNNSFFFFLSFSFMFSIIHILYYIYSISRCRWEYLTFFLILYFTVSIIYYRDTHNNILISHCVQMSYECSVKRGWCL